MADAGEIYADMGQHVGKQIAESMNAYHKESGSLEEIQQYLNMARSIQTNDFKTGKPKNFFSDQQVQDIQRLIDLRKIKAAGAAEAALGIGKGMVDKIQGGAAREHLAQQGPITASKGGVTFVFNPKSMAWQQVTAVPRNEVGMTATSQIAVQQRAGTAQSKGAQAQQKAFDTLLKGAGLSRSQLFDQSAQEHGVFNPDTGFEPTNQPAATPTPTPGGITVGDMWNAVGSIGATDPSQLPQASTSPTPSPTPVPSPTHVRVGYLPMQVQPSTDPKKPGKIIDKGKPGSIVPMDDLKTYQDAAAQLAGPQAYQALQYIRTTPDTSATDVNGNAWTPDSIKQYQQMAPKVAQKFKELVVKPEAQPAQTPQASTKPDTGITNIYGQPVFDTGGQAVNPTAPDTSEDDGEEE